MKSSRIAFITPIFTIGLSAGLMFGAQAADFYVSADKSYGTAEGADTDHRFDDLQAAIDAAAAEDTVWIADGFECKAGEYEYASGYKCRIYIDKALTLRSKSGDWTTGNAPIIRGSYATAGATGESRCGAGAVACVRGKGKSTITLMGLRLLEGATTKYVSAADASGGCAYGVTLRNCSCEGGAAYYGGATRACDTSDCTFRDCFANTGGAIYLETHSNAWIEGCSATGFGGGAIGTVSDSVITNCTAGSYGGGFGTGGTMYSISDSVIVDCSVSSNYGGAMYNANASRCQIIRCNRGAAANCKTYDCDFFGCYGAQGSDHACGSCIHTASSATRVSGCTFQSNESPVVGAAAGATGTVFENCTFDDNAGTVFRLNHNNHSMIISNCTIRCTNTTGYAISVYPWSTGTAPKFVTVFNSTIVGPVEGCGDYYNCLISDCNTVDIPAVSCTEKAAKHTNPAHPLSLYNCTVRGNYVETTAAGASGWVYAYNTVFYDNTSKAQVADGFKDAVYCRLDSSAVVEGVKTGTIFADPLLMNDEDGLPHPSEGSPCRASGDLQYVRTETDLAGNPRTSIKDGVTVVAMGACEFDPNLAGAEITCQPTARLAPASGTFTASCSGLGIDGITYYWDFNGDGTVDVVTAEPTCSYSYPMPGAYMATLYASNAVKGVSATLPMVILEGYFVSTHDIHEVEGLPGAWGIFTTVDGYEHLAYTNLQQAIDAASPGDIVWIDSDFVCDEGARTVTVVTGYTMDFRIVVDKPLTLRGKTGDWRTGPTICGAYGAGYDGTKASRRGEGAVACVRGVSGDRSQVIVEGVRLVGGATKAVTKNELCGACASYVTLKNCLAQGGAAYNGGCVGYCRMEGCHVEDGYAANNGGGTYGAFLTNSVVASCTGGTGGGCAGDTSVSSYKVIDCLITNCSVSSYGGGAYYGSCYGCKIVDCRAGNFGAASYRSDFYGCEVRGCESGALTGGSAYDCLFVSNKISNSSGAYASAYYFYPDGATASYVVSNCTFTGNQSPAVASGSYFGPDNLLVDCTITNNLGNGLRVYHANSPAFVRVVNCRFGSTPSGKFAVLTDKYSQDRTNASGPEVVNSVIEGPVQGSGEYYNCLFKNISVAAQAPVYCTEELATGPAGARRPLALVNCTVASNAATRATGGVGGGYVVAVNSIIRENVGKDGSVDSYLATSNSCVEADAAIGDAYRCTTERPRFDRNTPGREFVPRASALRGMAQVFAWMSDPADPRSRDLAGRDRITDGVPDMGAFEMYPPVGLILMVR